MKLHAKAFLLICLLVSSAAFAQNSFYKAYTLPAEAATPVINTLYQLKQGYIVVGASTGLYRFDGTGFFKYNKVRNVPDEVTAICETKDGKIWIGFGDGKLGWLLKNNIVLQNPEEGLPKKTIKKIIQDSSGIVWIATAGEGIYYYTNDHFYNINTDDGLSDNYVYDIKVTELGLFAATDGGINRCTFSKGKKEVVQFTTRNGLPDNIVRSIEPYTDELEGTKFLSLLIGMQDAGLGGYIAAPYMHTSKRAGAYSSNWNYGQINDLLYRNDNLFIASEESGLIVFAGFSRSGLNSTPAIILQKITCLLYDLEGNIWAAGNNQLIRTNGTKLRPVIQLEPSQATNLHTLLIDKDNHVWFNVAQGLKHMEKGADGKWIEKIFSLPVTINSQITALYEDKFENIWIGTMGNGAFFLDAKTGKFRKITESPLLSSASVLSITGKDKEIWIASLEGAVHCQMNDKNGNIYEPLSMKDFTSISGIGTNYIYNIFIDSKNRTWFATDGKGIAVYENGKITNYTQKNGLQSQVVYQMKEDQSGNIWFTTFNAGVVRFDGKHFRHFTTADGLTDMAVTSMTADKKGNLYLTHKKGIDIIHTFTNTDHTKEQYDEPPSHPQRLLDCEGEAGFGCIFEIFIQRYSYTECVCARCQLWKISSAVVGGDPFVTKTFQLVLILYLLWL